MLYTSGKMLLILFFCAILNGCLSTVWTGANLIYDRHHVYKKLNDFQLNAAVHRALYLDKTFKNSNCSIDVAVFHNDVLLAGHVSSYSLKREAQLRIEKIGGYRRLFNQLNVSKQSAQTLKDTWLTAIIRSKILADASINPNAFKIVTSDAIVYIMGEVKKDQAKKVIQIARETSGVDKVVTTMRYYTFSKDRIVS